MRPRSGRSGLRVRIGNEGARSQVRAAGEKRRGGSPEKRKTTRRKKRKNDDETTVTATTTATNTRGADGILPRQALDPGENGKAHPQPQGGAAVADQPEGEMEPVHRRPVSHHSRGWGQTASYPPVRPHLRL